MNKLKFEGFGLGQKIRAYDFKPVEGRGDCYVEGRITSVDTSDNPRGYNYYAIVCSADILGGVPTIHRIGQTICVPMQTSMDWDDRVTLID